MACQEPVVCTSGILNASITHVNDDHAILIGCYPCLYCKIRSEQMVIPLSVRGHATERSREDMCADHQRYISSGSIRKDAQKFFNCISVPIFDIPISQVNESDIVSISVNKHHAGLPTWSPHNVGDLH